MSIQAKLWHIIPVDIGEEFINPTNTMLEVDPSFYEFLNDDSIEIPKENYSKSDYSYLRKMREFIGRLDREVRDYFRDGKGTIYRQRSWPNVAGCFAKYILNENLFCYILINGIAVFYETGENIDFDSEEHFSVPVFYERQVYEDDYCVNKEDSPRKHQVYRFMEMMWRSVPGKRDREYSSSRRFRTNGVSYALCIAALDIPGFDSTVVDEQLRRNIHALIDTTAFNNIYQRDQWDIIRRKIDTDDYTATEIKTLSETLVYADSWSGVVIAGDIARNEKVLTWFLEFEIFLQAHWLLYDAYSDIIHRSQFSQIELQETLNRVEYSMVRIENSISSNVEQARHLMHESLIKSSDIHLIYDKMRGMIKNQLQMENMRQNKSRSTYNMLSNIALLIIAVLQIYGVILGLMQSGGLGRNEIASLLIVAVIAAVGIVFLVKGRD